MANGELLWYDLTVPQADEVRDFYAAVLNMTYSGEDMGGYEDYHMIDSEGNPRTGVCWKQGPNEKLPACWMVYFRTDDMAHAIELVQQNGGEVIDGPRAMGEGQMAFFRDPAGAYFGLIQEEARE